VMQTCLQNYIQE